MPEPRKPGRRARGRTADDSTAGESPPASSVPGAGGRGAGPGSAGGSAPTGGSPGTACIRRGVGSASTVAAPTGDSSSTRRPGTIAVLLAADAPPVTRPTLDTVR